MASARDGAALVAATVVVAVAALAPAWASPFHLRIGLSIFLSAGMAVGWFVLGGFARYYSFGHTAFVGVGAFAAGLALVVLPPLGWAAALALALGVAILSCVTLAVAIAWPLLRLRGHYFTIAMLAVALVCGEAATAFPVFRGGQGLNFPDIVPAALRPEVFFYYVALAALALSTAAASLIGRSRLGHGLRAIREDEDAAEMLGVPTTRTKFAAFVASAAITGAMGAIYGLNVGYITTDSVFRGALSLDMIVNSLVGGIGSLAGPIVGAVAMTLLTKVLLGGLLEYHLALTGLVVVVVVLRAPDGLIGLAANLCDRVLRRDAGAAPDPST
ncbi:MAG: branched-chain amino acid ABC transporter permease [Reyranellaceae bacterium]